VFLLYILTIGDVEVVLGSSAAQIPSQDEMHTMRKVKFDGILEFY
jgi:hypothetical protein